MIMKPASFVAIAFFAVLSFAQGQQPEPEVSCHPGPLAEPITLTYGPPTPNCKIHPVTDIDVFAFEVAKNSRVRLLLYAPTLYGRMEVFDPAGNPFASQGTSAVA